MAWNVYENNIFMMQVNENDLRIGVVWREICFSSQKSHDKWVEERETLNATHAVELLIHKLKSDGYTIPENKVDLAELIIKRYIIYPLGDGYVPFNNCALPEMVPSFIKDLTVKILQPFCNSYYDE